MAPLPTPSKAIAAHEAVMVATPSRPPVSPERWPGHGSFHDGGVVGWLAVANGTFGPGPETFVPGPNVPGPLSLRPSVRGVRSPSGPHPGLTRGSAFPIGGFL